MFSSSRRDSDGDGLGLRGLLGLGLGLGDFGLGQEEVHRDRDGAHHDEALQRARVEALLRLVERLVDRAKYGGDSTKKSLSIFSKATGLNAEDVNTALTSPKKIAYLEETVRSIETGQLKIRVRSLENEMALTRLGTQSKATTNLLLSSLIFFPLLLLLSLS